MEFSVEAAGACRRRDGSCKQTGSILGICMRGGPSPRMFLRMNVKRNGLRVRICQECESRGVVGATRGLRSDSRGRIAHVSLFVNMKMRVSFESGDVSGTSGAEAPCASWLGYRR